jgi:hypothetical protein
MVFISVYSHGFNSVDIYCYVQLVRFLQVVEEDPAIDALGSIVAMANVIKLGK